jgi:hypothetical protein
MKTLCFFAILLIAFSLFSDTGIQVSINPLGHITSKITVSNLQPEQGEIVEVNAVFSLDKTSRLFKEGKEYLIQDAFFSLKFKENHPENLAEKYNWEVVDSDNSIIISEKNPVISFNYKLRLKTSPLNFSLLGLYVAELKNGEPLSAGVYNTADYPLTSPQKPIPSRKNEGFERIDLNLDAENPDR